MFCKIGKDIVGLDIGGANLKAVVWSSPLEARAASMVFPMWKQPDRLADAVRELLEQLDASGRLAVTMTGELADCFANRREGVERIVNQLCQVVSPEDISVYSVEGRWCTADEAKQDPWSVAASNWHALAKWLAQWPPTAHAFQCAVLVDIGSTTVDVLPIVDGQLATNVGGRVARTDRDRLERSQLVYTGFRRTPICAVVQSFQLNGTNIPVMAELFATVDDAYLLLNQVDEDSEDCDSADGRPRTRRCAAARLARMIGEDADRLSDPELLQLAHQVAAAQAIQIAEAVDRNLALLKCGHDMPHLICSGHGLPLFERMVRKVILPHRPLRVSQFVSDEVSRGAPAAAVAWLYQMRPNPT